MANETTNLGDQTIQVVQAWSGENDAINKRKISAAEKAKLVAQNNQKLYGGLRNIKVSEEVINAFGNIINKMPEQAGLILPVLTAISQRQMDHVLDLQRKQAELAMDKSNKLADAVTGIASFATIISTIARYFGQDDFAETVEAKTKDIMGRVKIGLNTDNIGNGLDRSQNDLRSNLMRTIIANAKDVAGMADSVQDAAPSHFKTGIDPYVQGAANAPRTEPASTGAKTAPAAEAKGVSWKALQSDLRQENISAADEKRVLVIFGNAAGDNATLDTTAEAAALVKAIKAETSLNKFVPAVERTVKRAEREMHITGNT
ncbi:MAG: hypothetical protein A3J37_04440 [Alphaproteobacteria bacterium RIFCSPHIGHO2_12_FULL_45_9]|nr:MAG: hypothetical protein A3B66_00485 [Alphaproteobacteria bacterium RIFCSPHIGHO2_02_FULL_46_13]OFW98272.1 MAG: hypothetical protein A3J37_04440 [Alphaproteobacteria bacterium RIFCSPHIGHO2_12_FULL_45_9]